MLKARDGSPPPLLLPWCGTAGDPDTGRCAIDRFQYLALMAACLLVTLPLEVVLGARVYRRARTAAAAVVPVVLLFSAWDILGIHAGHWSYNPRFVTGIHLPFRMPVEELVFFIVIPLCALLTYEAVGLILERVRRQHLDGAR